MYACSLRVGLPVIAGRSLPPIGGETIAGAAQLRPSLPEWLATIATSGGSEETKPACPPKYAVPSAPKETHGSLAVSAVPPVQRVRPGIVVRCHVLPPSNEEATRSSRALKGPDRSCFQVATMFRRSVGLTAIAGSITSPVTLASSWKAPGQPAAKGLGPDAALRLLTLYGVAAATAGTVAAKLASNSSRPRIGRMWRRRLDRDISRLLWLFVGVAASTVRRVPARRPPAGWER